MCLRSEDRRESNLQQKTERREAPPLTSHAVADTCWEVPAFACMLILPLLLPLSEYHHRTLNPEGAAHTHKPPPTSSSSIFRCRCFSRIHSSLPIVRDSFFSPVLASLLRHGVLVLAYVWTEGDRQSSFHSICSMSSAASADTRLTDIS